jgi:hypothetical protein
VSSTASNYIIGTPKLNVQGTSARITTTSTLKIFSFPTSGPSAPITNPVIPFPTAWGPTEILIGGWGNLAFIPYIEFDRDLLYSQLLFVQSPNDGISWSSPAVFDQITNSGSIDLSYTNLLFTVSGNGNLYCVWRNQADTNKIYFNSSSNFGTGFTVRQRIPSIPTGDASHIVRSMNLSVISSGISDLFSLVYNVDSSLYVIQSTDGGTTFGEPAKIDSVSGPISYFTKPILVGNTNGTMYLSYGYFEMSNFGGPMGDRTGSKIRKSTNFGATWSLVDTSSTTMFAYTNLDITSSGILVSTYQEGTDLYVKSSLNGKDWSTPTQVNPTAGTAYGNDSYGFSTCLVDSANIAIAWIDNTTGRDEIFYRKMIIPTAPVTGVAEIARLYPTELTLDQNYPNPFNPTTQISFSLNHQSMVSLKLFDVLGREIKTLTSGEYQSGNHTITVDASALPSGVYIYRLQAGNFTAVRKLTLLK